MLDMEALKSALTKETVLVSVQHGQSGDRHAAGPQGHRGDRPRQGGAVPYRCHARLRPGALGLREIAGGPGDDRAHTIHGPKGVGGLLVKEGTPFSKWMDGGFQENNLRAGLEDIPGIVGFAKAAELVTEEENDTAGRSADRLIDRLLSEVEHTMLNGHRTGASPQNANVTYHYVEGESITLHLDMRGIEVTTGSACFSRSLEASHVITGHRRGPRASARLGALFTVGRSTASRRTQEVDAGGR